MTKVTIIGKATPIEKKKPIEFVKCIGAMSIDDAESTPNMWNNIELICKHYEANYDLMFAYDYRREDGMAYLGHFNDGVVEKEVGND